MDGDAAMERGAAAVSERPGRNALIEQFVADGLTTMFGNPGTVEQGFLDALADYPAMRYILTLHETIAVMAADGFARATRRPALVQIHSTPGLGNAIGALYQAHRGHAPLVVIGGDAGIRYQGMDAQMAGDLVAMAAPVTKWSTMVRHPASLLRVLRRAIKVAATPPMGPVYVCLPEDVLDQPVSDPVRPTLVPSTRSLPDEAEITAATRLLAGARKPMIFVGDGIAWSGAQAELATVAEALGAEVWEADAGELNMDTMHPLHQGATGHMFGSHSLPILRKGDVNLVCGTYILPEVYPELGEVFAPDARVIHFDLDPSAIARNHPVDIAALCDPKRVLGRLAEALATTMTSAEKAAAAERGRAIAAAKAARSEAVATPEPGAGPLHMTQFMQAFAERVPEDAIVFDEALTSSPAIVQFRPPTTPGRYFLTRGGSLGVGIPGAIGAQLANPGKLVFGFAGDGGAMYTIQALWTAARHSLPVKIVICNNRSYRLLQLNLMQFWAERSLPRHDFPPSFDLSEPPLHFGRMAEAMSVGAARVETASEIAPAIEAALAHPGPFLIDLVLEGDIHPEMIGLRCGQ